MFLFLSSFFFFFVGEGLSKKKKKVWFQLSNTMIKNLRTGQQNVPGSFLTFLLKEESQGSANVGKGWHMHMCEIVFIHIFTWINTQKPQ